MKNLMDDNDIWSKFLRLAEPVLGKPRATQALETLWSLESADDVLPVFKLLDLEASSSTIQQSALAGC